VKSGFLGYLAFLWVFFTYIKRGFNHWRHIQDDYLRAILIGSVLTFIGFFVGSVASPTLMRYNTTPVIGVMIGINEVIIRLNPKNPDKNDQK
jgi:cell division protein FtsW (lipid II flippase)